MKGKLVTKSLSDLSGLTEKSRISERRRAPFPVHPHDFCGTRALFNAMQPDSYVRPHLHKDQEEIMTAVQGVICITAFDNCGEVEERVLLGREDEIYVGIPAGTYHTAIAAVEDSMLLEFSQGPYNADAAKNFAPWAPDENSPEARKYFEDLRKKVALIIS